jgi:hypothetical protein
MLAIFDPKQRDDVGQQASQTQDQEPSVLKRVTLTYTPTAVGVTGTQPLAAKHTPSAGAAIDSKFA